MVSNPTRCQLYRSDQFYYWMKPEYPEKTIDAPQVADKRYHILLYFMQISYIIHSFHWTSGIC
jgi:hypothetical protein